MKLRKFDVFCISLACVCVTATVTALVLLYNFRSAYTEAALSLVANEIKDENNSTEVGKIADFLTFTTMSESSKTKLIEAARVPTAELFAVANKMETFSYSPSAVRALEDEIMALDTGSTAAFSVNHEILVVDRLIRQVYGGNVSFQTVQGDGLAFKKRYYCSNICIDECTDGSIRYLCHMEISAQGDKFFDYFFKDGEYTVSKKVNFYGFSYCNIVSKDWVAELLLDPETQKTFAAKISPK